MTPTITLKRLKELYSYNPLTGHFVRLTDRGFRKKGTRVGYKHDSLSVLYRRLSIDGQEYYEHRLAYFYMTGKFPTQQVDHINGDGTDNRWCNLRIVTQAQNMWNAKMPCTNTTGYKNITFRRGKFEVILKKNHQRIMVGRFPIIEEAILARDAAVLIHRGEYARYE